MTNARLRLHSNTSTRAIIKTLFVKDCTEGLDRQPGRDANFPLLKESRISDRNATLPFAWCLLLHELLAGVKLEVRITQNTHLRTIETFDFSLFADP